MAPVKTLIVLRHAQAEQNAATDHSRVLTQIGTQQAREAGDWVRSLGIPIDAAIVSSSARTDSTMKALKVLESYETTSEAYNASASELQGLVWQLSGEPSCAIVVAHNPGVSDLCRQLGHLRPLSPASGIAVRWQGDWSDFLHVPCDIVSTFSPSQ